MNAVELPDTIPTEGNARVEGDIAGVTVTWSSFGGVTDAHLAAAEAPQQVLLTDKGLVATMAWTLAQVADRLAGQGQHFRLYADERPGRPDHLAVAVVDAAGMAEAGRFVLLRGKVAEPEAAGADGAVTDPDVAVLDVVTDNGPWLDLYREALASLPQRGMTTEAGVRRQVEDPALARPLFLGISDPADPTRLVAAITAAAVASAPGAPPVGELSLLAVREDHRRRGLGSRLVAAALGHLADAGVRTAFTYVDDGNDAATAFFEAAGFKERGARVYFGVPAGSGA